MTRRILMSIAWVLLVLIIGFARFPARVPVSGPAYSIVDFGAVGGGDASQAATNATAINAAIVAAASSISPGYVYVPPVAGGYVVDNNAVKISVPNVSIRGDASMGSNLDWAPTSTIIGKGQGHTFTIVASGGGGSIKGLEFRSFAPGDQHGSNAFIEVEATAITLSDLHLHSPNVGISCQLPINAQGEFWIRDVLIDGQVKFSGMSVSIGNAAITMQHVIMSSFPNPPTYGVLLTSAGEVVMCSGCDIIAMGTCCAILPGFNGVKGQYVLAGFFSDTLFDSPNGQGGLFVCPLTDGFVGNLKFTNCWASTLNNNAGKNPTNGFTLIGDQSKAARPIQAITFTNCNSQCFVNHCGWYAKNVYGLNISHCTATGNFNGIQTYGVTGILSGNMCGDFANPPLGFAAGNAAYGILIEKSQIALGNDNLLLGNVVGPIKIIP